MGAPPVAEFSPFVLIAREPVADAQPDVTDEDFARRCLYYDILAHPETWVKLLPIFFDALFDAAEHLTFSTPGGVRVAFDLVGQVRAAGARVSRWEGADE